MSVGLARFLREGKASLPRVSPEHPMLGAPPGWASHFWLHFWASPTWWPQAEAPGLEREAGVLQQYDLQASVLFDTSVVAAAWSRRNPVI